MEKSSASFDLYQREIGRYPLITEQTLRDLVHRAKSGDTIARNAIVNANLALVIMLARRFMWKCRNLKMEDLVAAGNVGLVIAADKYDADKKYFDDQSGQMKYVKFSTYATYWINDSIRRMIEKDEDLLRGPRGSLCRPKVYQMDHPVKNDDGVKFHNFLFRDDISGISILELREKMERLEAARLEVIRFYQAEATADEKLLLDKFYSTVHPINKEHKLTFSELAALTGYSVRGIQNVGRKMLVRLAKRYSVNVEYLPRLVEIISEIKIFLQDFYQR